MNALAVATEGRLDDAMLKLALADKALVSSNGVLCPRPIAADRVPPAPDVILARHSPDAAKRCQRPRP
jgi:hypothetical protein